MTGTPDPEAAGKTLILKVGALLFSLCDVGSATSKIICASESFQL